MENYKPLVKGVAYHGNRMLTHIREDMQDLAASGFTSVLHMFTHNDLDRHKNIMKEIFDITKYYGLDVMVDNWGLGGAPGDKSHFLAYYPDAHQYYNDGTMHPTSACYNQQSFVDFTKRWIDAVLEAGGQKLYWDEPRLYYKELEDGAVNWTCRCETCQKLFEERYNKPMPTVITKEVDEFRKWSISNYIQTVSAYAKKNGMYNSVCVMFFENQGVDLDSIISTPSLDNIGSDPYWVNVANGYPETYKYVYELAKKNIDICEKYNKDHNLWIQTFNNPTDREEEIIAAADAVYDAGARTIFAWGYRGSDANDYRAKSPDRTWYATKAAFEHITERYRAECRNATRSALGLK